MNARDNIRIANCSGYYGDKLSAAKELIEGGPIDFLTGDYLAELTMGILYSQKLKRGEDMAALELFLSSTEMLRRPVKQKGIKIVAHAGGLNPKSMANELNKINEELSLEMNVAYIDGDDIVDDLSTLQDQGEEFIHLWISMFQ